MMTSSHLDLTKQEMCICVLKGLAVAVEEEHYSSTMTQINNNYCRWILDLLNNTEYTYGHTDLNNCRFTLII
jgi:hypothetical protein